MVRTVRFLLILTIGGVWGCADHSEKGPAPGDSGPGSNRIEADSSAVGSVPSTSPSAGTDVSKEKAPADPPTSAVGAEGASAAGDGSAPAVVAGPPADGRDAPEVSKLLTQMSSEASIERRAAADALDELGPEAMPSVVKALEGGTELEKRGAALYLIGRVSPAHGDAAAALIGALASTDEVVRHAALQAVERLTTEQVQRALPALAALVANGDETAAYRSRAARAIAKLEGLGGPAVPDLMRVARDDTDLGVRLAVFFTLSKVAPPEEAERFFLEELSGNRQAELRRVAAKWLTRVAVSEKSLQGLTAALGDVEKAVRLEATDSLVAIGRPAVPSLIKALESPDVAVRRHAVVTLGKLGPLAADAVPKLKRLADDPDQEVRALAASALGLIRA